VLASLNHPNVVQIFGTEQSGNIHALAMEFIDGEDLSQRLERPQTPPQSESVTVPANERVGLHDGEQRPPRDEPGQHHQRHASGVTGAARLRLAFDVEGELLAEEQILGRKPAVGVQSGPEELKRIEHHIEGRGNHGSIIPPEQQSRGLRRQSQQMQYLRITTNFAGTPKERAA
jgi:hypothetical protein